LIQQKTLFPEKSGFRIKTTPVVFYCTNSKINLTFFNEQINLLKQTKITHFWLLFDIEFLLSILFSIKTKESAKMSTELSVSK